MLFATLHMSLGLYKVANFIQAESILSCSCVDTSSEVMNAFFRVGFADENDVYSSASMHGIANY
jgi:dihydropteroate synthase